MEVAIVFISAFAVVFGIFYLFFTTRNKERLALIEKGADANIFFSKKGERRTAPFWKVLILNLALLLIGIGFGILLGAILSYFFATPPFAPVRSSKVVVSEETLYVASVFLSAGAFLFLGFHLTKKLDKE